MVGRQWPPERAFNASQDIVTLRNNSHYRFADLLWQRGRSFISDALRIVTHPSYRHTILHDLLIDTLFIDGTPLAAIDLSTMGLEASRWRCTWPSVNATWRTCVAWSRIDAPQESHLLTVQNNTCSILHSLATIVQRRLRHRMCHPAPPNIAAVHLRLGDKGLATFGAVRTHPDTRVKYWSMHGYGPTVPLHQQAAALSCKVATVVLSGTINFSPEVLPSGERTHHFTFSEIMERSTHQQLETLSAALSQCLPRSSRPRREEERGGRIAQPSLFKWRSTASVDEDICYFATADYFVPSIGGFSDTMPLLRAMMQTRKRAFRCVPTTRRGYAPRVTGDSSVANPQRTVPPVGSCEYKRAVCVHHQVPSSWERVATLRSAKKTYRERAADEGLVFPLHESRTLALPGRSGGS